LRFDIFSDAFDDGNDDSVVALFTSTDKDKVTDKVTDMITYPGVLQDTIQSTNPDTIQGAEKIHEATGNQSTDEAAEPARADVTNPFEMEDLFLLPLEPEGRENEIHRVKREWRVPFALKNSDESSFRAETTVLGKKNNESLENPSQKGKDRFDSTGNLSRSSQDRFSSDRKRTLSSPVRFISATSRSPDKQSRSGSGGNTGLTINSFSTANTGFTINSFSTANTGFNANTGSTKSADSIANAGSTANTGSKSGGRLRFAESPGSQAGFDMSLPMKTSGLSTGRMQDIPIPGISASERLLKNHPRTATGDAAGQSAKMTSAPSPLRSGGIPSKRHSDVSAFSHSLDMKTNDMKINDMKMNDVKMNDMKMNGLDLSFHSTSEVFSKSSAMRDENRNGHSTKWRGLHGR
jgi:hypothetical protein